MKKTKSNTKWFGIAGSISGATSIMGSWQVCHAVCLGIISLLSVIGISVTGMPLAFLTKWAIQLWTVALVFLGIAGFFYFSKKCISGKLIAFNTGMIIAGTPFQAVQKYNAVFWIVGGIIALISISLFVKDKLLKMRCAHEKNANPFILYAVLILVLIGLGYSMINAFSPAAPAQTVQSAPLSKTVSSGSTDQGDVSIDLTPQEVNGGKLTVALAANTHSVDLSQFDLKEITTLEYEGKQVKPVSAPSLNGHHSSGNLVFDIGKDISKFTIKINSIPKVQERVFSWS